MSNLRRVPANKGTPLIPLKSLLGSALHISSIKVVPKDHKAGEDHLFTLGKLVYTSEPARRHPSGSGYHKSLEPFGQVLGSDIPPSPKLPVQIDQPAGRLLRRPDLPAWG